MKPTKRVIVDSAIQPIFWQFVGIEDSDFEVLKKLDTRKDGLSIMQISFQLKDMKSCITNS